MQIHSTAVISPLAELASDVRIGPFCVIEAGAVLGPGCELASGVVIKAGTRLGTQNRIDVGAVLGSAPQHMGAGAEVGQLIVGSDNQIREYVTIHRAYQPGQETRIGDGNMFMASSHIGHDCSVGDRNVLANNVMLAGHVEMGCRNYIGGGAAFHQFCRIGSYTMVGGLAQVKRDVPPYVMVDGSTGLLVGLNLVGLRRAGFSVEDRKTLKSAYRLAFRSELTQAEKLHALRREFPLDPAKKIWEFLLGGTRGVLTDRRRERASKPPAQPGERNTTHSPQIIPFRRAG